MVFIRHKYVKCCITWAMCLSVCDNGEHTSSLYLSVYNIAFSYCYNTMRSRAVTSIKTLQSLKITQIHFIFALISLSMLTLAYQLRSLQAKQYTQWVSEISFRGFSLPMTEIYFSSHTAVEMYMAARWSVDISPLRPIWTWQPRRNLHERVAKWNKCHRLYHIQIICSWWLNQGITSDIIDPVFTDYSSASTRIVKVITLPAST